MALEHLERFSFFIFTKETQRSPYKNRFLTSIRFTHFTKQNILSYVNLYLTVHNNKTKQTPPTKKSNALFYTLFNSWDLQIKSINQVLVLHSIIMLL